MIAPLVVQVPEPPPAEGLDGVEGVPVPMGEGGETPAGAVGPAPVGAVGVAVTVTSVVDVDGRAGPLEAPGAKTPPPPLEGGGDGLVGAADC